MSNTTIPTPRYLAFHNGKRIAEGTEAEVEQVRAQTDGLVLVFDIATGEQIEIPDPSAPAATPTNTVPPRPGRPKLGVVPREVTLLPHDWEWLAQQPGGASVTLRKLVLKARRLAEGADRIRMAQVVCYRFVSAIAGNERGYEEAIRALFGGNSDNFVRHTETWPTDVRDHARHLAAAAFNATTVATPTVADSAAANASASATTPTNSAPANSAPLNAEPMKAAPADTSATQSVSPRNPPTA